MNITTLAAGALLLLTTSCAAHPPVTVVATTPPPVPITEDCLGNGAICTASLIGSQAVVTISNNTQPGYRWQAQITCEYGADQHTGVAEPLPGPATMTAECSHGARALNWTIIYNPAPEQSDKPKPCGGDKPGACP